MRIWDVHPGFLNDRSLLGEHRELHGIFSILKNNKTGYSRHPETLRWKSNLKSLFLRHEMLVAEMILRGFNHRSPIEADTVGGRGNVPVLHWPDVYLDSPSEQYGILKSKYAGKQTGRIPLPDKTHRLWTSHKYSALARDPRTYSEMGPRVAANDISFEELACLMVDVLRTPPPTGRLTNAICHMWGYVSGYSSIHPDNNDLETLMGEIQRQTFHHQIDYLLQSTALSEFMVWLSFR